MSSSDGKPSDTSGTVVSVNNDLTPRDRSNANLRPWQPGQSGNPSGRPKQSREFRAKCRELSMKLLDRLSERMDDPTAAVTVGEDGKFIYGPGIGELTRSLETLANHGGFLTADKLATVEAAFAKMLLAIAAANNLTAEQKSQALEQANQLQIEAMGENDE